MAYAPIQTVIEIQEADIYQQNKVVLSQVSASVFRGELVWLIGKTGSGKSSLLKTLYADLPLRNGRAKVAGFDLGNLAAAEVPMLRRQLGIIFQDFNLLSDRNVFENLRFVLLATGWTDPTRIHARIQEMLDSVGLSAKAQKMPHELSGGEQQRVVIARALLNNPEIVLADEPTGNLDPETSDEVLFLLRSLCHERNTAVLIATHDYMVLEKFPARIIRCQGGGILDDQQFDLK